MANHKINLFYSPGACSLAPHICLYASGLQFETTNADVRQGFQQKYIKHNPKQQVPFLELEPDVILTEVPAIITAISQLAPEKKLLGEGIEVLRSYEWFNFLSGQVHARRFGPLFRPFRFVNDEKLYPMVKEMQMKSLKDEAFPYIESRIDTLKPVDEANFRAVDAFLYAIYRWANAVGINLKDFPKYNSRMEELSKTKPVRQAIEEEGIDLTTHNKELQKKS